MQKLSIVFGFFAMCLLNTTCEKQGKMLQVQEISRDNLLGRLQKPLGTIVEIRGKWMVTVDNAETVHKSTNSVFSVIEINGRDLQLPVEFNGRFVYFLDGSLKATSSAPTIVRYRVFEGIETGGIPNDAFDGDAPYADPLPFGLYSSLTIIGGGNADRSGHDGS